MVTPLNFDRAGAPAPRAHYGPYDPGVAQLQRLLNEAGAEPPLVVDGLFGPKTEAALRQYQAASAEPNPHTPRRAPRIDEPPPPDTVRGGSLQQRDDQTRARARAQRGTPRSEPPSSTAPVRPIQAAGPDGELEEIQRRTAQSAQRELDSGVREDPSQGRNRGQRIDQYARDARMPAGGEWCGYFTGFNYSEAARESGLSFRENIRFHSMQKARSFFEYRTYTNASRAENERLDALQAQHRAEGSTRRWMTLSGSGGESHAQSHRRPYESYEPSNLPIRAGDTAVFSRGHLGVVTSYDQNTGRLTTIEGNAGNLGDRVVQRSYDLNDPRDRARFEGFGRPARGDFTAS